MSMIVGSAESETLEAANCDANDTGKRVALQDAMMSNGVFVIAEFIAAHGVGSIDLWINYGDEMPEFKSLAFRKACSREALLRQAEAVARDNEADGIALKGFE